jgi:hypothetical protein
MRTSAACRRSWLGDGTRMRIAAMTANALRRKFESGPSSSTTAALDAAGGGPPASTEFVRPERTAARLRSGDGTGAASDVVRPSGTGPLCALTRGTGTAGGRGDTEFERDDRVICELLDSVRRRPSLPAAVGGASDVDTVSDATTEPSRTGGRGNDAGSATLPALSSEPAIGTNTSSADGTRGPATPTDGEWGSATSDSTDMTAVAPASVGARRSPPTPTPLPVPEPPIAATRAARLFIAAAVRSRVCSWVRLRAHARGVRSCAANPGVRVAYVSERRSS